MQKNKLKGKYVMFIDRQGKYRVEKVVKTTGNTLTLKNAYNEKHRIHSTKVYGDRTKNKILGVVIKRKIRLRTMHEYLEEIEWT